MTFRKYRKMDILSKSSKHNIYKQATNLVGKKSKRQSESLEKDELQSGRGLIQTKIDTVASLLVENENVDQSIKKSFFGSTSISFSFVQIVIFSSMNI